MARRELQWSLALLGLALAGMAGCATETPIDPRKAVVDARTVLRSAAGEPNDDTTRLAAMEAIGEVMPEEGGILKEGLNDASARARFAAAMAIGDARYAPALPALQAKARMYTGEPDRRTYCAILYALHRLGDDTETRKLGSLLYDREPQVRAIAAQVLGKVGDPASVGVLQKALQGEIDPRARFNMIEALTVLGDPGAREKLEGYAASPYTDYQLEAIPALGREYSPDTMAKLDGLTDEKYSTRVRIKAAGVMARLGHSPDWSYRLALAAARNPKRFVIGDENADRKATELEIASLQQIAAIALGWMRRVEALPVLHGLLENPSGPVRVAAAMSIIRLAGERPRAAAAGPESRPAGAPALRTAGAKD